MKKIDSLTVLKTTLSISLTTLLLQTNQAQEVSPPVWKKHLIVQEESNFTAVAAGFTSREYADVITSYQGKIILLTAPNWTEQTLYQFPVANQTAIHSAVMDVDQDGDPDWIGGFAKGPAIWLENPGKKDATWTARTIDTDCNSIHCFLVADVNHDGKNDILINNFSPNGPLGNSAMWYETPSDPKAGKPWPRHIFAKGDAPGGSHYFGFGDLNGDGLGEITLAAKGAPFPGGDWFAYWKNPGAGKQKKPWEKVILREHETGATNITPAKIDNDSHTDIVATNGHGKGVFWMKAPKWEKQMIDPDMESPHCLAVADLDQDGDNDIATCGFISRRMTIYLNDSKGSFTRQDIDLDQESYDLRAIDMDGDGDLDLLNAGRKSNNVTWYENPLK